MSADFTNTASNADAPSEFTNNPHVHISSHPVLSHKITILRSSATPSHTFRAVLREVTYHLGYEATARLTTRPVAITVPVPRKVVNNDNNNNNSSASNNTKPKKIIDHMDCTGLKLKENIALIPIMRSGLGMTESMLELLPMASIHHIGMYKVIGQSPVQYYNRLPRQCQAGVAYILDPVISTSQTVMSLIAILKRVSKVYISFIEHASF